MKEIITSITIEQPVTTSTLVAARTTPAKFPVSTPRVLNQRKRAQLSGGAAAMQAPKEPEPKKIKTIVLKVIEAIRNPPIILTESQKKK